MKYQTPTQNRVKKKESFGQVRRVETGGYIPLKKRIDMFKRAGKIYKDYVNQMYDYYGSEMPPEEEMMIDPTRTKEFDQIDADKLMEGISARSIERAKQINAEKEKAKVEQKKEYEQYLADKKAKESEKKD